MIYGVEANVVDDARADRPESDGQELSTTPEYVVFDIETTGLSVIEQQNH